MSAWVAWCIVCSFIAIAVGVACWATSSGWPLFGLLLLPSLKTKG